MRGNAWLIESSKFAERRLLIAWKCAELRLPIAWKCAELRPANAWKCAEPRLACECELRGRLRTAARVPGTRVGSAREVRLKCCSSAWNRGSTHWWLPYLYGTGTLRVKLYKSDKNMKGTFYHITTCQFAVTTTTTTNRQNSAIKLSPGSHFHQ